MAEQNILAEAQKSNRSPLKTIRAKCLDCAGGQPSEVRECPIPACPLHAYRMGKNPNFSESTREQRRLRAEKMVQDKTLIPRISKNSLQQQAIQQSKSKNYIKGHDAQPESFSSDLLRDNPQITSIQGTLGEVLA